MTDKNTVQSDEIDLVEVFTTLYKRKLLIILTTIIVACLGIAYTFIATPWYKAEATIEIGSYNDAKTSKKKYLEKGKNIEKLLNVRYIDVFKNIKGRDSKISSISSSKGAEQFILISAMGKSNKLAIKEVKTLISNLRLQHKSIIDEIISNKQSALDDLDLDILNINNNTVIGIKANINYITKTKIPSLNKKIIATKQELDEAKIQLEKAINNLTNNNASLAALRLTQIQALQSKISLNEIKIINFNSSKELIVSVSLPKLKRNLDKINKIDIPKIDEQRKLIYLSMQSHNYRNTDIIGDIITRKSPAKPRRLIISFISIILGGVLGIFLALFLEFIKTIKQRSKP